MSDLAVALSWSTTGDGTKGRVIPGVGMKRVPNVLVRTTPVAFTVVSLPQEDSSEPPVVDEFELAFQKASSKLDEMAARALRARKDGRTTRFPG